MTDKEKILAFLEGMSKGCCPKETKEIIINIIIPWINDLPKESVSKEFEKALAEEWQGYVDRGAATVDALEDNTQEFAFAKGFYRGARWQKEKDEKKFELLKEWFEDIAEKCERLTSGNVSHNGKMIRGYARNCAEYIKSDLL